MTKEKKTDKSLESKMKDMVDMYNEKLSKYKALGDEMNKILGGIETLDSIIKEKNA